jgi:flagellar hook protein FlgE
MSLISVLQTAHTGLSAAVVAVDAVSHNVANSRTNGYKAIRPVNVTQPPGERGAVIEIGTGVRVAGFVTDYSPGPRIVASHMTERDEIRFEDEAWDAELPTAIEEQLIEEGVIELSNTDVGEELVELILAEEHFLANANVFETADELLADLVHLVRTS